MTLANQLVLADRLNDAVNLADGLGFDGCVIGNLTWSESIFIEEVCEAIGLYAERAWYGVGYEVGHVVVMW